MARVLLTGILLGAFVAAQVGPVSLLCVRTSTRSGFGPGWAVGAGAALVDLVYAALGVAGAASVVQLAPVRLVLGLAGAACWPGMGLRTLHAAFRVRLGGETDAEVARPARRPAAPGVVATASNPLTIVSGRRSSAPRPRRPWSRLAADVVALLVGVAVGSLAWFSVLAVVAARVGSRLGRRALASSTSSPAPVWCCFGAVLGVRTLQEA